MDLKQNGLPHNSSSSNNCVNGNGNSQQNGRQTPQKASRRRCRSECLTTTAPSLGLQIERYNLKHKETPSSEHYAIKSAQQSLRNSYTIKASHQMKIAEIYASGNEIVGKMNGDRYASKKDLENGSNGHSRVDSKDSIDLKDLYLQEDVYKNGTTCLNGFRQHPVVAMSHHHRYSAERGMVKNDFGYFNPRNSVFDANRRRIRARSESEPHELYTVAGPSRSVSGNRTEDVSLKRVREANSPPLDSKIVNRTSSSTIYRSKESLPSGSTTPTVLVGSQIGLAGKSGPLRLKSKSPGVSALRVKSGKLRPTTPTRRRSPMLRKSVTPSRELSREKSVDLKTETETDETSSLQSLEVNAVSEKEDADSLEDDDDDLPLNGLEDDDIDGSVTDPEDNYASSLAVSSKKTSNKNLPLPKICIDDALEAPKLPAPLAPSMFPNCPPYITFSTHSEKGVAMPPSIQKLLKWKLTAITPVIVRRILFNSNFRLLRKTNDWMGQWGKHMKSPGFKTLRSYQKFNHLPGSFQIGRKDRVWRNLQNQMVKHGKKEFGFMPRTFIIPPDLKTLRTVWPKYAQRNARWIIKPPASARGTGIKVVNQWAQIPKRKPLIVQRYIERPLLINGSKFDLRLYVLVTSMNPLRVFMHTDGLARFASVKYSEKADTLNDRYMHLTNYSINKLSSNYTKNEDANACVGHKWTIKSLWTYLNDQGYNVALLWNALKNLVLRTILAGESPINALTKVNVQNKYNCYELFGIDVILDSELVPWLLEVNISPSLHSASPLDAHVKGPLVTSLLNTVMYQIPPKIPLAQQVELIEELGLKGPLCFDKRIYCTGLNKNERQKHSQYAIKAMQREDYLTSILDNLTPDDIRCLLLAEDELARSAPLERIFPTTHTHNYLTYTDNPRYYNRLLDAWECRYANRRQEGIDLLKSFCEKNVHLEVPPQTFQKESNDDENGFVVEDLAPASSATTTTPSVVAESTKKSPSQDTENLTVTCPTNALALTDKQNALNNTSSNNLFNNLPPLLPLSPISQQENCALGLNSNGIINCTSGKLLTNGTNNENNAKQHSETGGNNTTNNATPNSTEILVNQ